MHSLVMSLSRDVVKKTIAMVNSGLTYTVLGF